MRDLRLTPKQEFQARLINMLPRDFIPEQPTDEAILNAVKNISIGYLNLENKLSFIEAKEHSCSQIEKISKSDVLVKCKGKNCSAEGSNMHSIECRAEHDAAVYSGAGNRNPLARYKGYTGEKLPKNANSDERAAWMEGHNARKS